MKKDFTILVCSHKKDFCYSGEGYLPIQVGKSKSSVDLGIQGDDTGDNISEKNPNYCELTAQYWLWKNSTDAKYIGLNHYRRYFAFGGINNGGYYFQNVAEKDVKPELLDINANVEKDLEKYDIILAKPMTYPVPLFVHYSTAHDRKDLDELRKTIKELYPDYVRAFDEVMKGNKLSLCNMFVMKKETFNHYSKWLFDILFTLEKRIEIPNDAYQSRIFGFMAERLLNVYVRKNNLKAKYYPIVKISDEKKVNPIKGTIKNLLAFISSSIIKRSSEITNKY